MRSSRRATGAAAAILAAALLLPLALAAANPLVEESGVISQTRSKAATAGACIRPVEEMRRNHMDLLEHKRDATVYQGIRTADASIAGCIDCHADRDENGKFIPVNAEGQFCQTCHAAVAVKPDCFQCHRTTPEVATP